MKREAPPVGQNTVSTIAESAYSRIRTDIIFGTLPPGRRLKLEQLKKDYDASVSTLREILNRLSSETLVVAEGQRGFEVAPVSAEHLREIADLRLLLEGHALEQSFAAGDVEWEARVVAAHHKLAGLESRMKNGDRSEVKAWKRYDWEFHQALISACGSTVLMETHASVFDQYLRYQLLALSFRGDIAAEEHAGLRDCALTKDSVRACEILTQHIQGGVEHALSMGLPFGGPRKK
ncbi:GntR family transcriptional regulator [Oricola sp.]|uniref:GntR family transcriptional regulator n=1 Tax=Oricola sp. TaxID=1979950 RepID=UPI0025E22FC0|nr:GntR family transcriptional regulator [Oricola sp.]MCI5077333.1 GntR family transcriptional regulator [Oricola sp.]